MFVAEVAETFGCSQRSKLSASSARQYLLGRCTESMPEPDLYWVKAGVTSRPTTAVVPLIIEVSAASLEYDRTTKSRLYALDNLQEYWIVNVESQCIEVRSQAVDGSFRQEEVFGRSDSIRPTCWASAKLDIDQLFRSAGL